MEKKYLGYVSDVIPNNDESKGSNAILKVVAIKENGSYKKLSSNELKDCCPPDGNVFGPSFFNEQNQSFCNKTFIEFEITDSKVKERKSLNQADKIVNYAHRPKGINLDRLIECGKEDINSIIKNGYIPPETLNTMIDKNIFAGKDIKFLLYNSTEQRGIGVFNYNSNSDIIKANFGKDVFEFIIPDCEVVADNDGRKYFLFNEQKSLNRKSIIDFMTNEQLAEWLKGKVNDFASVDKNTISILSKLPESQSIEDDRDVSRFERLSKKIEAFEINIKILIEILSKHPEYLNNINLIETEVKNKFEKIYLEDAPQIIKENNKKIEELEKEISELETKLKSEREKIASKIEKEKIKLSEDNIRLSEQIKKKTAQINAINENYDSVIASISAMVPALGLHTERMIAEEFCNITKRNFPKSENACSFSQIEEEDEESFISFLKRHVCFENEKFYEYLKQTKKIFSHKACFIPNTAVAYLFAKAFRNTEVMILHIEHDWLHYSDFVKHGLLEAFMEANNNDGKNYILVLDGLNVTQPECGLRPLLNLINDNEPFLEGCGFAFPENMTVMATVLPSSGDNAIGLKLSVEYFRKWFAIGDPTKETDKIFLPENFWNNEVEGKYGYIEPSYLLKEKIIEKSELLDKYIYY